MQSMALRYIALCAFCLGLAGGAPVFGTAAYAAGSQADRPMLTNSALHRWMTGDLLAYLRFELNHHPRFKGRKLQLQPAGNSGLAAAINNTLRDRLLNIEGLQLVPAFARSGFNPTGPNSIDDLVCTPPRGADYRLRFTIADLGASKTEVRLLIEDAETGAALTGFGKHWQGRLSRSERRLQRQNHSGHLPQGSTDKPYSSDSPELAAQHLVTHIACGLRPGVNTTTAVYWQTPAASSITFDKTLTIARHYLHSFREFTLARQPQQADITLQPEEAPLGPGLHQFWLAGLTAASGTPVPGVNAVAYVAMRDRSAGILRQHRTEPATELADTLLSPAVESPAAMAPQDQGGVPRSNPLDALQVNVVEVQQKTRRHQRADLYLTLRIRNQSQWPIAYSFTLSGGYFDRCRPYRRDYRHERFGTLRETIGPGETQVEELVIRNLQHNPGRLSSRNKCAGVVDLDGFEKFALRGEKVTDYVNWSL